MITPKIKALFQFIEYLHSNIDNFNLNNDLIKELELLNEERQKVSSKKTFKDKLKYDEVQAVIETKFKTLQGNTANLIKAKAKELNVCNFDNEPTYSFNGIETDIHQLKENFSNEDLPEIFKHKSQYLEYRSNTHGTFLSLQFFFDELDELTKSLFDYFKDTQQNEFEPFETKAIPVNNISEAVQGFKQGQTKFIIPNLLGKTQNRIQEQLADFSFFQIEVIADLEFEGKIYKDIKQRNNDSILTPENWEHHKETFFSQRMATYKDSYTLAEKLKLELLSLEKLPINKTDYQILKDRYKAYLEQKQALPPQQTEKQKPEPKETELSERIKKHFGFFNRNCPRKHKQILNDTDFEKLIEWTIWYFENDFKVPEISEPIKVVNTNKTFVQLAFKYLFKKLHKSSPYPETLFDFYQSAFNPYSEDKKSNFEAVKNNDEVKKLMQIE